MWCQCMSLWERTITIPCMIVYLTILNPWINSFLHYSEDSDESPGVKLWFLQLFVRLVFLRLSNLCSWFVFDFWFYPRFYNGFLCKNIYVSYHRFNPWFSKIIVSIIQYYSWTVHKFMIVFHLLHMILHVCNLYKWPLSYKLKTQELSTYMKNESQTKTWVSSKQKLLY